MGSFPSVGRLGVLRDVWEAYLVLGSIHYKY